MGMLAMARPQRRLNDQAIIPERDSARLDLSTPNLSTFIYKP